MHSLQPLTFAFEMPATQSFLIIGQGLAGTTLALKLLQAGHTVRVIDNGHRNSSSIVAAGMWNPIVFRRINKTWRADEFIDSSRDFYRRMEEMLGLQFYYPLEIWRRHSSQTEENLWFEKRPLPEFRAYLKSTEVDHNDNEFGDFPFGYGIVCRAGYVDLVTYLEGARNYLTSCGALGQREDLTELRIEELADEFGVDRIIDCRGYRSAQSRRWSYLSFALTKGEVLTLHCPELHLDRIYNAGFFLLPVGNQHFRLGATFDWDHIDEEPTQERRLELLDKFERAVKTPYTVLDQRAGVRPTVNDRHPLLGIHPVDRRHCIFNGLGTKGVMMAPRLADHLIDLLIHGHPLPSDIDIARCKHQK